MVDHQREVIVSQHGQNYADQKVLAIFHFREVIGTDGIFLRGAFDPETKTIYLRRGCVATVAPGFDGVVELHWEPAKIELIPVEPSHDLGFWTFPAQDKEGK